MGITYLCLILRFEMTQESIPLLLQAQRIGHQVYIRPIADTLMVIISGPIILIRLLGVVMTGMSDTLLDLLEIAELLNNWRVSEMEPAYFNICYFYKTWLSGASEVEGSSRAYEIWKRLLTLRVERAGKSFPN